MSSMIESQRPGAAEWPPPSAGSAAPSASEPAQPRQPLRAWRRVRWIALAVLAGLLLLGGGFGVGYAVGNWVGSSAVSGFAPSQRGGMPDGGFPSGGPGSLGGQGSGTGTIRARTPIPERTRAPAPQPGRRVRRAREGRPDVRSGCTGADGGTPTASPRPLRGSALLADGVRPANRRDRGRRRRNTSPTGASSVT